MKLEVLVSTMNCNNPKELAEKMNINSDAIIINQCDKVAYEEFKYRNHSIKVYSFNERGLGLSRNNAIMRATGDIVLLADDDEIFEIDYEKKIIDEFSKNKKADMIIFDFKALNSDKISIPTIKKCTKINKYNCLKYGSVRFAFKLYKIRKNNISFTQICGAGTKYGSGEDSIFLYDCLNAKMNIFTSPTVIASVSFSKSSWFKGFNEKYYFDKGALFQMLYKNKSIIFMIAFIIKNRKENNNLSFFRKINLMIQGKKDFEGK